MQTIQGKAVTLKFFLSPALWTAVMNKNQSDSWSHCIAPFYRSPVSTYCFLSSNVKIPTEVKVLFACFF